MKTAPAYMDKLIDLAACCIQNQCERNRLERVKITVESIMDELTFHLDSERDAVGHYGFTRGNLRFARSAKARRAAAVYILLATPEEVGMRASHTTGYSRLNDWKRNNSELAGAAPAVQVAPSVFSAFDATIDSFLVECVRTGKDLSNPVDRAAVAHTLSLMLHHTPEIHGARALVRYSLAEVPKYCGLTTEERMAITPEDFDAMKAWTATSC